MIRIAEAVQNALHWTQTGAFSRDYVLESGDLPVATLSFLRPFGSLAIGEAAEGRWTFKRTGVFRPHLTVRVEGHEDDIIVFEPTWSYSGRVSLADGRVLKWASGSFWGGAWEFQDERGDRVIQYRRRDGFVTRKAEVFVAPAALDWPDVSLLTIFGWYLVVLMDESNDAVITAG